jgi:hypothetical protein
MASRQNDKEQATGKMLGREIINMGQLNVYASRALVGLAGTLLAISVRGVDASPPQVLRAGAAAVEIEADDSMVVGGGIAPGRLAGQEAPLLATAIVLDDDSTRICLVAIDVLMMNRDYLDQAARQIENEVGVPFDNVLINCSHTHHAPSTVTIHDYARDDEFCRRTVQAIVAASKRASELAQMNPPAVPVFRLGQEATVGQNSRQLLKDGRVYWIGPRDGFVRPTGPFDADLPVLAFRQPGGKMSGLLFSHSTHCIGVRDPMKSPGFYGLAAQELSQALDTPVAFLSGAAGSTHNLTLSCDEMVFRLKAAVHESLGAVQPMATAKLAAIRREFTFKIRRFDEGAEDRAVSEYVAAYAPTHAENIVRVFRESREKQRAHQGEVRKTWLQAIRIGDVAFVAVPAEFFTTLGIEIKRRSPLRYTYVLGLSNDYIGYVPDRDAFRLGGYQTWTGLHSFVEPGTGEAIVDEAVRMVGELQIAN